MEPFILGRVEHGEDVIPKDRVPAEGNVTAGLPHRQAKARLEPLAILVDQRDEADRYLEQGAAEPHDGVEIGVWLGIQYTQ